MRPLSALSREEAAGLQGLVLDLDDTVLDHGLLTEPAYAAVHRAHHAGLSVVLATGRPSGWGEVLARMWPVAGAVTENGAVAFRREGRGVRRIDSVSAEERERRRLGVASILAAVRAEFPELTLADDVDLRRSDVTLDIGERCHVAAERIVAVAALARRLGARVTVSSVHLHLSLDGDDKASGTLRFLHDELGVDPTTARARFAFAGDSGNDAPCFAAFRTTFAVANVAPYVGALSVPPRFVAGGERGAGLVEIVARLLALR